MAFFTPIRTMVICLVLMAVFAVDVVVAGPKAETLLVLLILGLAAVLNALRHVRPERFTSASGQRQSGMSIFWIAAAAFGLFAIFRLFLGDA